MPLPAATPAVVLSITPDVDGNYFAVFTDVNHYLRYVGSIALNFVLPIDDTLTLSIGTEFHLRQGGTGAITVVGETPDLTINPAYGCNNTTIGIGATITIKKVAADEWDIIGGQLEAA
jgi:hypothetical protein